ncbi:MAG: hypothetical protein GF330_05660, partial [Candidatus Eisenbacteria bacterium]|nr:hypothetical protein [Candidatus Eisenbacteria bacterium]
MSVFDPTPARSHCGPRRGPSAVRRFSLLLAAALGILSCAGENEGQSGRDAPPASSAGGSDSLPDWRAMWNFSDPGATEARFRETLRSAEALPRCYRLTLRTQIARTLGLQGRFGDAKALLDSIARAFEAEDACTGAARARYLLERGRVLNSSGAPGRSQPHFMEALRVAEQAGEECLAIDAAHMLGIVAPPEERMRWNLRALELAEASESRCALGWRGPLYHNIGMTHLEAGRFDEALGFFERDQAFRETHGNPLSLRIATWSVAHTLRRMGRTEEALAMQREIEAT